MKHLMILGVLFLILGMVASTPAGDMENNVLSEAEEAMMSAVEDDSDDDIGDDDEIALLQDDGMEDSELESSFDLQEAETQGNIYNRGVIKHGDTIALQTFVRSNWAGCAGRLCGRATCPRMHMTGHDWKNCWGEVFIIYRYPGPGAVRVGDKVGFYYPREHGKWLGCVNHHCDKRTCPGTPNYRYGFSTKHSWHRCWGEVFQIYAKGKRTGSIINADDDVFLYYVRDKLWVGQGYSGYMGKRNCFGKHPPPPRSRYDGCSEETFTIWKKPW